MLDAMFFGAFAMIIVYNLGYFVIINSATYASYFSYHVTLFIIMLFYTGMIEIGWFELHIDKVPIGIFFLSIGMLLAFSRDFFDLKTLYPKIARYFNKLIILNFAILVLSAFAISNIYLENMAISFVILEAIGLLAFSAYLGFKKKNIYARFYFCSFTFLFITLIVVFISYFHIVNLSQNTPYWFEIGILLEAAGLSFALTYQQKETTLNLRQNELLFKELSHRVQNNLQQIISILTMQIENTQNNEVKEHLEDTIKRIGSISLIHKTLQNSSNIGKINMNTYFNNLIKGYRRLNEKVEFKVVCNDNIELKLDKLAPLALILNELITNSFKYAFKDIDDATIHIKLEEKEMMNFTYEDNGVGFTEELVIDSIGTKLINILSKSQLKGKLDIDSNKGYYFSLLFVK